MLLKNFFLCLCCEKKLLNFENIKKSYFINIPRVGFSKLLHRYTIEILKYPQ